MDMEIPNLKMHMDHICFVSSYSESLDQERAVIRENGGTSWSETEHARNRILATMQKGTRQIIHQQQHIHSVIWELKLYELGAPGNARCFADLLSSANSSRRFVGRRTASTFNCNIPWSSPTPLKIGCCNIKLFCYLFVWIFCDLRTSMVCCHVPAFFR